MNVNKLVEFIPYGKEKGVSKRELSKKLFGANDKAIVGLIEQLRNNYIIFVNEKGNYYRPNDIEELNGFIKTQKKKRAATNLALAIAYDEIEKLKRGKPDVK